MLMKPLLALPDGSMKYQCVKCGEEMTGQAGVEPTHLCKTAQVEDNKILAVFEDWFKNSKQAFLDDEADVQRYKRAYMLAFLHGAGLMFNNVQQILNNQQIPPHAKMQVLQRMAADLNDIQNRGLNPTQAANDSPV